MTALAGAALLVLALAETVTVANLSALLAVHVAVGVLLVGLLALKLASTGYRFLRYYAGAPAFVRKGPPRLALRVLAPLLVATTLALVGSGIGLLVTGPAQAGLLLPIHVLSFLIWSPLIAIHAFAYLRRVPHLIADDWRMHPAEQVSGSWRRVGATVGALLAGAAAAVLVLPGAAPWIAWIKVNAVGPGFFIAGVSLATAVLLAANRCKWR